MKITQLDYSAILNANASEFNNKIASDNNARLKLNQTALGLQHDQEDLNRTKSAINSVLSGASTVGNILQKVSQVKTYNDVQKVNDTLSSQAISFQKNVLETINNEDAKNYYNEDGTFKVPETLSSFMDSQVSEIKNLGLSGEVEKQALAQLKGIHNKTELEMAKTFYTKNVSEIAQSRQNQLNTLMNYDANNNNTAMGDKAIDSYTDYSPLEKQNAKFIYRKNVEMTSWQNNSINLAKTKGATDAIKFIRSIPSESIDEQSRLKLESLANSVASKEDNNLSASYAKYMADGLQSKIPAQIREEIEPALEDMDPARKATIEKSINTIQYNWAMEQIAPRIKDIESMSTGQLKSLKDIATNGWDFYFKGIESSQDALTDNIDKMISKKQKEEGQLESAKLETANTNMEYVYTSFENGVFNGKDAINFMKSEANIEGSLIDDITANNFIKKINNNLVPSDYKTISDKFIKDFIESNKKLDAKQMGIINDTIRAATADLFMASSKGEITKSDFRESLDNLSLTLTAKGISTLETYDEGVVTSGVEDLGKIQENLGEDNTNIVTLKDGKYEWITPTANKNYTTLAKGLQNELNEQFDIGLLPFHLEEVGNKVLPVPVFESDKNMFKYIKNKVYYKYNDKWKAIEDYDTTENNPEIKNMFDKLYLRNNLWLNRQSKKTTGGLF